MTTPDTRRRPYEIVNVARDPDAVTLDLFQRGDEAAADAAQWHWAALERA